MTWDRFSLAHPEAAADWIAHWCGLCINPPRCVFGMLGDDVYLATSVEEDRRQWRRDHGRVEWQEVAQ